MSRPTVAFPLRALVMVAGVATAWQSASAQCTPEWSPNFGVHGLPGTVSHSVVFDDGTGPALYAAGRGFRRADGRTAIGIAKLDGERWTALGRGLRAISVGPFGLDTPGVINDLAVFDIDGAGPMPAELYVAGLFRPVQSDGTVLAATRVAKWNGSSWTVVPEYATGMIGQGTSLLVANQFNPPRLYVGIAQPGLLSFLTTGGRTDLGNVADIYSRAVLALENYDPDGSGPLPRQIFVSGASDASLTTVLALNADGATIDNAIPSPPITPEKLRSYDPDGTGPQIPKLYAGTVDDENLLWTWNGTLWAALPIPETTGFDLISNIADLEVIDFGGGPRLYIAGNWETTPPPGQPRELYSKLIAWNGTSLEPLPETISGEVGLGRSVQTIAKARLGGRDVLFAGGEFLRAGEVFSPNAGFFDPSSARWVPRLTGAANGASTLGQTIQSIVDLDGAGSEPARAVAFEIPSRQVVKEFDGTAWSSSSLAYPPFQPGLLLRYDRGDGDALYCTGGYDGPTIPGGWGLARLEGGTWREYQELLTTVDSNGDVRATAIFDVDGNGPQRPWMFFGGNASSDPGNPFPAIVAHDGFVEHQVAVGVFDTFAQIRSLAVFNDGTGVKLYAAGSLRANGQNAARRDVVARYDGESWETIASTSSGDFSVTGMRVVEEAGQSRLYVFGSFSELNQNSSVFRLARWTGGGWVTDKNPVLVPVPGSGFSAASIQDIASFDDGSGASLFVCGNFLTIGGAAANLLAKWNAGASAWSAVGSGVNSFGDFPRAQASRLIVWDEDGDGPNRAGLYVLGNFDNAGGLFSSNVARWGCPPVPPCPADFNNDGSVDFFDYLDFVQAFDTGAAGADFNRDGSVDFFDYLDFVAAFDAGC